MRQLRSEFPDPQQRKEVIHAYTSSIATIWLVLTPIIGFCFVLVLGLRAYSLKRNIVKGGQQQQNGAPGLQAENSAQNDLEKGIKEVEVREEDEEDEEDEIREEKGKEKATQDAGVEYISRVEERASIPEANGTSSRPAVSEGSGDSAVATLKG